MAKHLGTFQFIKIRRETVLQTWLEKETQKQIKDIQSMKSTQVKISEELAQIKSEVRSNYLILFI